MKAKRYRIELTSEQLFTVEKIFDDVAVQIQRALADTFSKLEYCKTKKCDRFRSKLFDEAVRAYDMCRTISAICQRARTEDE